MLYNKINYLYLPIKNLFNKVFIKLKMIKKITFFGICVYYVPCDPLGSCQKDYRDYDRKDDVLLKTAIASLQLLLRW